MLVSPTKQEEASTTCRQSTPQHKCAEILSQQRLDLICSQAAKRSRTYTWKVSSASAFRRIARAAQISLARRHIMEPASPFRQSDLGDGAALA